MKKNRYAAGKHAARQRRTSRLNYQALEPRQVLTTWIPQGPFSATDGQVENVTPNDQIAGAIHTVLAHPTDPDILYIGGTNSGVWRTNNAQDASPSWQNLTDDLPSQSIGALAFDVSLSTRETIYAGVGRYSSYGRTGNDRVGLYKSTDGGDSWTVLNDNLVGANISGIAANGNNVVVSVNTADDFSFTNTGIFRSIDGGLTFSQVSIGDGSGTTGLPEGVSYDLVADPREPETLYTSMVFADLNSTGTNAIYKSTDGGATWVERSDSLINSLIISAGTSNLELAVGNDNNVYAAIINFGNLEGLFRSGNGGLTWNQMDTPSTNEDGVDVGLNPRGGKGPGPGASPSDLAGGQGTIHFSILADPGDPDIVYVGGDRQPRSDGDTGTFPNSIGATDFTGRLFRGDASLEEGSQFVHLTHSDSLGAAGGGTANSSAPHADSREMVFDVLGNLIEVDDGGIYRRTSPRDNTGDWFAITGDLQVTESHNVAYDNNSNTFLSGNQDTGTTYQPTEGASTWVSLSTADGGDVAVDNISRAASSESIRYTSNQFLFNFRQTIWDADGNLLNTFVPLLNGFNGDGVFVTPVEVNEIDGNRLVIQGGTGTYESFNQGDDVANLNAAPNAGFIQNAIAYGGRQGTTDNPDVLWVGSGTEVFVRPTAGDTLAETANPGFGEVRDLALNPVNWANAFVVDDDQVFMTIDIGVSWTDITGDLLTAATEVYSTDYVQTPRGDVVVVGTNRGVFASEIATIGTWNKVGFGLPNVPVFNVEYDATDNVLAVGTLGRGSWAMPAADLVVNPIRTLDFGDAPDSSQTGFPGTYPVTALEGGAGHVNIGPTLGTQRDVETDPQHSPNALGDDNDQFIDDEDGVNFGAVIGSTTSTTPTTLSVTLGNADPVSNRLDAWIDWNRDGDWSDPGEKIFSNLDLGNVDGTRTLGYTIPQLTADQTGLTYARFRISTAGGLGVTGTAADGEVEDYEIRVENAIAPTNGDDVIVITMNDDFVDVDVNGESFQVDAGAGSTLSLDAMAGNDQLTIFDSTGDDVTTIQDNRVSLVGGFSLIVDSVEDVRLVSRGGNDVANLFGTDSDEVFESFATGAMLSGSGFEYETQDYTRTNAFALGGLDLAFLRDSDGDDELFASNLFSNLTTPFGTYNVRDFDRVAVHATEGGFDFARLVGTDGADTLFANENLASLTNASQVDVPGAEINANGFERTWADGAGGDDTAVLLGTDGDDRFNSRPANSYLFADGYFNQAVRFETVTAEDTAGVDEAILFDSPSPDNFHGTPEYAALFNDQFRSQVNGFDKVSAFASAGFDRATFVDSDGNDRYVARARSAFMVGEGYLNYTENFNAASAASTGGTDVAIFRSSVADDRFFGSQAESYMTGATYFNQAFDFRNVTAFLDSGGNDIGTFQDSSGADNFVGNENRAVLFNDDYIVHTTGLELAIARSEKGGEDNLSVNEIDYEVRIVGDWV